MHRIISSSSASLFPPSPDDTCDTCEEQDMRGDVRMGHGFSNHFIKHCGSPDPVALVYKGKIEMQKTPWLTELLR